MWIVVVQKKNNNPIAMLMICGYIRFEISFSISYMLNYYYNQKYFNIHDRILFISLCKFSFDGKIIETCAINETYNM